MTPADYEALRPFATARQAEHLDAMQEHGTQKKAAAALGLSTRSIELSMQRLVRVAALKGHSPNHDMTHVVPDGFKVKGVSTYYDDEGKVRAQWVKSQIDADRQFEIIRDAVLASIEDYRGGMGVVTPPEHCSDDLLTLVPIGDPHLGLYAWRKEAGEDFDTEIARADLLAGVQMAVKAGPKTTTCIVANLGDYYHSDNFENRTSRSGHALDVDSRWSRVARIGIQVFIDAIKTSLAHHEKVIVISKPGNHDDISGAMLALALDQIFSDEPRVTIDVTPSPFSYYSFGKNLFGFCHGHNVKPTALGEIMAADRAQEWGASLYRYWHTGHIHSNNSMDARGWRWESHRTLAAADAWTHASGYRSGRDIKSIVYHKDYGELGRNTFDIRMIRGMK